MPLSYSPLTSFALCDAASKKITHRVKTLTTRDAVLDLADDNAVLSQEEVAKRLAKANADLAKATFELSQPGLDVEATAVLTDRVDGLKIRRRTLERLTAKVAGLDDFMVDVDAEEVAVRVGKLQEILAGIATQRATLTA